MAGPAVEVKRYKFKPISLLMGLDKLIYIPTRHPLRHHDEVVIFHRHSQQWQHVRVAKGFPPYCFFAEPLPR